MNLLEDMKTRAKQNPKTIVFPEGDQENIIRAARLLADQKIAKPILLSINNSAQQRADQLNIATNDLTIIDINDPASRQPIKDKQEIDNPKRVKFLDNLLGDPLTFGALYTKFELADAMVAGIKYTTSEVILTAMTHIGLAPDTSLTSSIFVMRIPDWRGPEGEGLVYADCGVNPNPDASGLADIAITTAETTQQILGWEPRIAFLSFSTKGSAMDDSLQKIINATEIVHQKRPDLKIDGELQVDTALDIEIAKRKGLSDSPVAGKANIMIFPDLNAGNIAYKITQQLAGADAYGPFLQGFARTVSDLSRGSTVDDVIGVATMAVLKAQASQ